MRAASSIEHRHHLLAELRESIRRIERRPAGRSGVAPSGLADLDDALPGGGFPRGALSELCGGEASGKTAAALSLLASMGEEELFGWVDGRGELYPPAAAARGVDLRRLLIVRPSFDSAAGAGRHAQDERRLQASLWAAF